MFQYNTASLCRSKGRKSTVNTIPTTKLGVKPMREEEQQGQDVFEPHRANRINSPKQTTTRATTAHYQAQQVATAAVIEATVQETDQTTEVNNDRRQQQQQEEKEQSRKRRNRRRQQYQQQRKQGQHSNISNRVNRGNTATSATAGQKSISVSETTTTHRTAVEVGTKSSTQSNEICDHHPPSPS
jgi:hypothetical protein